MRRSAEKRGFTSDLSYKQRHHLAKTLSIILLFCLMVQTVLSPIAKFVSAEGTNLSISLDQSVVNEDVVFTATLTDTADDSSGTRSFSVPEGLTIIGVSAGQGNIDLISNDNQTFSFNWKEASNQQVRVQVKAKTAGDFNVLFSSADSSVSTAVTVLSSGTEATSDNQESTQDEIAVTEDNQESAQDETTATEEENSEENKFEEESIVNESEGPSALSSENQAVMAEARDGEKLPDPDHTLNDNGLKVNQVSFQNESDLKYIVATLYDVETGEVYDSFFLEVSPNGIQGNSHKELYGSYKFNVKITIYWVNGEKTDYTSNHQSSASGNWLVMKGTDFNMPPIIPTPDPVGSVEIIKEVKSTDNEQLNGTFAFNLYNSEGQKVGNTLSIDTSNGTGSVKVDDLKVGTYTVEEVDPSNSIDGYLLSSVSINSVASANYKTTVDVAANATTAVTFTNTYEKVKPSIVLEKSIVNKEAVDGEYIFAPGETVEYQIKVTNDGNVDLSNLSLTDVLLRDTLLSDEQLEITGYEGAFSLEVGKDRTFTATFKVPEDEVGGTVYKNTATAKNDKVQASDDATLKVEVLPDLSVKKTVDKNVAKPGETVKYTYTVENTGNSDLKVTLADVFSKDNQVLDEQLVIKDADGNVYDGKAFDLAYKGVAKFTAEYTIPANTKAGTVFHNVVTVISGDIEKTDNETVTVENVPKLSVDKSVDKNEAKPGEKVTYTYTVENLGNGDLEVTLADVFSENGQKLDEQLVLKDADGNIYDGKAFALAYKGTATFTAEYTIPANTKAGTVFHNVVTATSGELTATDDENVTVLDDPGLTVDKTVDKNVAKPGETVTYTYTVTNTGNSDLKVTLADVFSKNGKELDDQLVLKDADGNVYDGKAFTLAYKETVIFTAEYTIPANTKVDTVFHNVVTATSGDLTATDEETVTVDNNPALSVDKSVDKNVAKPGETVTYTYTVKNLGNSDLQVKLADVFSQNDKELDEQLVLKDKDGNIYDGKAFTLAYEGTVTFTAEYIIPENTKVDTVFHNVVTVTSGDLTATDEENVTVTADPGLTVDKSVNKNEAKPGETVKYTYTVTNTGNSDLEVTLADVFNKNGKELDEQLVLKDADGNIYDGKAFTLAYEGSATFTAEYTIPANTKVDTVFHNVVTATSEDLTATDEENVTVTADPGLTVDKSVNKNEAKPGETVKYTYTVINTGNSDLEVTLADVFSENGKELDEQLVLKDADGNIYDGKAFTLAYKGTVTFTAEYTIPDHTKVDTVFHNVVTVTSGDLTATDEENVTVTADPGLTVDKSADKNEAKPGETVKYTYTVTNTGNNDLEVTLDDVFKQNGKELDEQLVLKDADGNIYDGEAFTLAYEGSATFTAEYTIPANTKVDTVFYNVVTATSGKLTATDEENVTVTADPGLTVDKSVNKNEAKPGETVKYTYTVTNTGNSDLKVTLADVFSENGKELDEQLVLKDADGNIYDGKAFTLAYKGTVTFTAEYTVPDHTKVDTVFHNVVTVTSGDLTATDEENVTVTADPGLAVDKSADKNEAKPGETVIYTYTVTNTGNNDLEVTLDDVFSQNGKELDEQLVLKDADGNIYDGKAFTLAYEGSATFTAEYTVPENTKVGTVFHNVVTATSGDLTATDEENVTVSKDPGLTVDKSVDKNVAKPGETVTYTYTVTNTGNSDLEVTLSDVFSKNGKELDDQLVLKDADGKVYDGKAFTLAYEGTATFTAEYTIPANTKVDTVFHNVVTATSGDLVSTDEESVTVDNDPGLMVDKSVDKNVAKPGETVTYTYTVKNLGNSDLEVTLADVFSQNGKELDEQLVLKDADGNVYDGRAFTLAYEGTVIFTAEYTIPENTKVDTNFNNVVTVTSGDLTATDEESVTVEKVPNMDVEKTADKNSAKPGETVTYSIVVTNTGNTDMNVTLSDVFSANGKELDEQLTLKDSEGRIYTGETFELAYEGTATFTAEYTIPEDAKADTVYQNVAVATSDDLVVKDDEDVTVDQVPSLKVEKTADKTQYLPGETVTYTINVTNDGNVDLEGITLEDVLSKNDVVADQQLTIEGYEDAFNLAVGETASFTSKFVIPENDLADTTYKNVVKATTGDTTGEDEETIVVDPTYAFTIEKTADKTEATVGDKVTYSIVVTNTGNKALTNVHVTDEMIGLDTIIDQLEVNESKTLTGEYVVTADDIGDLENIATATVDVDGNTITHEASAVVKVSAKVAPAVAVDETPTTIDKIVTWVQNPKTGDATINTLLILFVFVLAGSGLYVYRRKHRG